MEIESAVAFLGGIVLLAAGATAFRALAGTRAAWALGVGLGAMGLARTGSAVYLALFSVPPLPGVDWLTAVDVVVGGGNILLWLLITEGIASLPRSLRARREQQRCRPARF